MTSSECSDVHPLTSEELVAESTEADILNQCLGEDLDSIREVFRKSFKSSYPEKTREALEEKLEQAINRIIDQDLVINQLQSLLTGKIAYIPTVVANIPQIYKHLTKEDGPTMSMSCMFGEGHFIKCVKLDCHCMCHK
jgi:hypothetical protein